MKVKKRNVYLSIFLGVQILFISWIKNNPSLIEIYYSNGIYPYISSLLRYIIGWIPFSVGDFLIIFFVFYCCYYLTNLIKTEFKNLKIKIIEITAFLSVIYFFFYLFWGLNYFREPLAKKLGYKSSKYSNEELIELSNFLISYLNTTHLEITNSSKIKITVPYSNQEIYLLAKEGYDNLSKKFPQFTYDYGKVKNSVMSLIQTYNGTSGYMNPFTGEAQVNHRIPKTSIPTTTCHEMAHQLGYAAENEANFIGFLAALANDDLYFKYAALRMATRYSIFELYKRDRNKYWEIYNKINQGIINDFKESSDFWNSYSNPFEPIIKKGYDAYLKSNNQIKGLESYNYVVDLFISYFKPIIHKK